ncbi:MAG: DUF3473 domain-containing protein [Candidatus Competibacteraceae bacterium]
MTKTALRRINDKFEKPFVFYLHPWEIDPRQPRINCGVLSTFRHYTNLHRCEQRLRHLLHDFQLGPSKRHSEDIIYLNNTL